MSESTLSAPDGRTPLALILGVQRPSLSAEELAFFRAANPYGLFLGRRNMKDPVQTRALCASFRAFVSRFFDATGAGPEPAYLDADPEFRDAMTVGRKL